MNTDQVQQISLNIIFHFENKKSSEILVPKNNYTATFEKEKEKRGYIEF